MKKIILIPAITLYAMSANSQTFATIGSGFSTAKVGVLNLQAGRKFGSHSVYYNQLNHLSTRANIPQIVGIKYRHNVSDFGISCGLDYWLLNNAGGNEEQALINHSLIKITKKWNVGYGVNYTFPNIPLKLETNVSGKYVMLTLGMVVNFKSTYE